MASIFVEFTDADQATVQNFADKAKANIDWAESHKPSVYWTPVHNNFNAAAVFLEDKLGYTRGTLYGNGSMTGYDPQTGGITPTGK